MSPEASAAGSSAVDDTVDRLPPLGPVAGYRPLPSVYDEMIDADGRPREAWSHVGRLIDGLGTVELGRRRGEAARLLANDGVEYQFAAVSGSSELGAEEPATTIRRRWELDPLPALLDSAQWAEIEHGVIQRAELLSLILADLYGQRRLVRSGLVPPELLFDHPGFLREADQISIPGSQLPTCAVDVARDAEGGWWALTDRAQTPSGFGYALENRVVISRVFPSMYRDVQAHRLAPFFRSLRSALRAAAPDGVDEPRIVVLSPGPWSETAFEHAFLASYLGYLLVEGADLTVRNGRVWLRSLGHLEPVDVILRRVDSAFCDPLELRSESLLGVPGLLEAARQGTVSVVNPLGSGVLENPSLLALLPRLCQHMLGQPLRLPSVPSWWCGEPEGRRHVLANLDQLVIKSTTRDQDGRTVLGWAISSAERDELRRRIEAAPHGWVGQEPLDLATVPASTERGLEPRHMLMRTFLVARGESYAAMPGALARTAPTTRGALIAQGSHRAVYKDVWVAASEPEELTGFWLQPSRRIEPDAAPELTPTSRAAENLFWLGRYAERAEALVRLLRVVEDRRNDFADGMNPAGNACLGILMDALAQVSGSELGGAEMGDAEMGGAEMGGAEMGGAERGGAEMGGAEMGGAERGGAELSGLEVDAALRALITDAGHAGSLAHSVRRLRDSAYPVRDQLSADTWLVLGALERELLAPAAPGSASGAGAIGEGAIGAGAGGFSPGQLARVLTSLLALGGLTGESMVHDQGWRFMSAGRRLERSLQMVTLLRATVATARDTATDSLLLESVLTVSESIITYRRRYRSHAQLGTVLDLLLLDPENPRSVGYQLERLGISVTSVARQDPPGRLTEAERVVLQTKTTLQLADLGAMVDDVAPLPAPEAHPSPDDPDAESQEVPARGRRPQLAAFLDVLSRQLRHCGEVVDSEHFTHLLPQRRLPTPAGRVDGAESAAHLRLV